MAQNRKTKGKITINGIPTGGLRVKAFDQDYALGVPVFSSFLGEATTDSNGNYSISYSPNTYGAIPGDEDNINWQPYKPDLYIKVWRGSENLKKSSVKKNVTSEICIINLDVKNDEIHYSFTELPPEEIATSFPCNYLMQWPGYETKTKSVIIDGRDVIIQAWRGYCPSYMPGMVGGVGAEVGIYYRDWQPGMWWPDHQHKKQINFTLINPITNKVFFNASTKNCWWRHKWMREISYAQYIQHNNVPASPNEYILEFTIDEKRYAWGVNEEIKEE